MARSHHLELIPLGGLGEFGMNLMVYRHGDECLVVDAGMMFPGAEHLGVDVVIPDLTFLEDCGTLHGVVVTHGHEDHIGALPFLLERHDVPVYATALTTALVRRRLGEHDLDTRERLRSLPTDGTVLHLGPFSVEALPVAHSIPDAVMLVVRTPAGTVVHTADFKLDPLPLDGVGLDLGRLAALGREGVLALLSDSTNADVPGFTLGEQTVAPAFDDLLNRARGRVFVTTFASNVHRLQQVIHLAVRHGRRVAVVGSSMATHIDIAHRLGLLTIPAGTRVEAEVAMSQDPDRTLLLVSGSQGEPMSALARVAVDRHREVRIEDGDMVIHSARVIPGNEKSIGRMFDHLLRRGAELITGSEARVHVSGHPSREELRVVLNLVRPRFLIPIHGDYRQLHAHARLGEEAGLPPGRVVLVETGDHVVLEDRGATVAGRVPVGKVFIDATFEEVEVSVLRDRRKIAGDGLVVPVVALNRGEGSINGGLEIVSRGFLQGGEEAVILSEAKSLAARIVDEATPEERSDEGLLKARLQTELKRFLRRRTQKRPLIIPVILEL
ncbi:MAG: ribonuclease J [Acidobacteriota bacterium]|nr:ribonuclease J [Acidobacteriota bacterium]